MAYRCVATSVAGFVQQLAVAYVTHGYWFYVTGQIPENKDSAVVDRKLIDRYGIDVSKWTRVRRKRRGLANLQYLRYKRFFVLIATPGEHPFFGAEGKEIRDIRRTPIRFINYSIGCRLGRNGGRYHASVRIQLEHYQELKAHFQASATNLTVEDLIRDIRLLPYEPYAPVRDQLQGLLRAVNGQRKLAGLPTVPSRAIYWLRKSIQAVHVPRLSAL